MYMDHTWTHLYSQNFQTQLDIIQIIIPYLQQFWNSKNFESTEKFVIHLVAESALNWLG